MTVFIFFTSNISLYYIVVSYFQNNCNSAPLPTRFPSYLTSYFRFLTVAIPPSQKKLCDNKFSKKYVRNIVQKIFNQNTLLQKIPIWMCVCVSKCVCLFLLSESESFVTVKFFGSEILMISDISELPELPEIPMRFLENVCVCMCVSVCVFILAGI